jgi:prophage maintenance system killer protein
VARTFLILNSYDINVADEEKVRVFIATAEKLISEGQLAQWYKANGQPA